MVRVTCIVSRSLIMEAGIVERLRHHFEHYDADCIVTAT
jgi:hypothetical protein